MFSEMFYDFDLWQILVAAVTVLVVAMELGYRNGARTKTNTDDIAHAGNTDDIDESILELIPTSLLGLLALLLGFTFSMAVARFDIRKKALLSEANAIETSYLRTNLLLPEDIEPSRQALRLYLDHRIEFKKFTFKERSDYNTRTKSLQADVWNLAAKNSTARRDATSAMYTVAVNQMIDLGSEREFANDDHVPEVVYYMVFALMMGCTFSIASIYGRRQRGRTSPILLALALGLVLALIQDLDRPSRGLVQIKSDLLIDLKKTLSK